MASAHLYVPDTPLSLAELTAARLDGHLVELDDAFIPADAVETAALRARALQTLLGEDLAATHHSAAWIHGAPIPPPARHRVQRASARRLSHVISRRVLYHDHPIPADDVVAIGGVWVTTPARTLTDLVRTGHGADLAVARLLLEAGIASISDGLAWLQASGPVHDKRPAQRTLRDWAVHGWAEHGWAEHEGAEHGWAEHGWAEHGRAGHGWSPAVAQPEVTRYTS